MGKIGNGTVIGYTQNVVEEVIDADGHLRRKTDEEEIRFAELGNVAPAGVLRTQQFTPTADFLLTRLESKITAPAMVSGTHQETFQKNGAFTTSTTTTTTTTTTT